MPSAEGLKVGCCGFPLSLARYAATFQVAEVQQTFYQPPLPRTLERWRGQVPSDFEFTLKAWQLITHEASSPTYRRLRAKLSDQQSREAGAFRVNSTVMAAWERTRECARLLGSRVVLFQCPARFGPTRENKANLRSFFRAVHRAAGAQPESERLTAVWEPRGTWKPEEVQELCEELGLVHAVDPYQQPTTTSGMGYFRLHGITGYRYRFTTADLEQLLMMARSRTPCYVLFNNIAMLADARRFQQLVPFQLFRPNPRKCDASPVPKVRDGRYGASQCCAVQSGIHSPIKLERH
jgi:uncharacterized protein YecE (DUF72 family)